MKTIVYKASTRGHFENDWLNTQYSFSFADYFDRVRMNFGALRVLNDDIILPSSGFGKHPHDNMEIITIPLSGSLSHKDSMGHQQEIKVNEVQVMSAGTGIFHSEFNSSSDEICSLLQIWIYPNQHNIRPRYDQKKFQTEIAVNQWQILVSGPESINGSLTINQNAKISRVNLTANTTIEYHLDKSSYGSYIFLVDGEIELANEHLTNRDAIGIYNTYEFNIKAIRDSYLINIEVPER
jgi:redox-sensitive bicupin YhaK (pirin superfamily)